MTSENKPIQADPQLHSLEKAAEEMSLHVNVNKMYICFNPQGDISTLNSSSLKSEDKFTYLGSSVPLIESEINMRQLQAWTAIDRLSITWKSD